MAVVVGALHAPGPDLARFHRSGVVIALSLLLVIAFAGVGVTASRFRPPAVPLHADTIALGPGGVVTEAAAADVVPGTRVLAGTADTAIVRRRGRRRP